jgi:uncharacterized protein HemX
MGFDTVFNRILELGGLWAALFLGACLVAGLLYRELRNTEKDCRTSSELTAEKRLAEAKSVLTALERNTASAASRADALEKINASLSKLVEGFTILTQTQNSRGERCREQMDRIERRLEQVARGAEPTPRG